ncbi:MAG: peptidoglycan DD-metalloendopeptidase family protein [Deltaproteobacteria bacterium]|nr:peptidoglycan DD-metalloendopeptidase family protein [Deltaproteobacteria bacterium]
MKNNVTLYLMNRNNASMKRVSLSTPATYLILVIILTVFSGIFYLGYDYYQLKKTSLNAERLELKVTNQLSEIRSQDKQIQNFNLKMEQLKSKLNDINNFEKKIKVMANMEDSTQTGLFGVGGALPDDLDTMAPLTKKHNTLLREMHNQIEDINEEAVKKKVGFENVVNYLEDQGNLMASTPNIRPAKGWVASRFGHRMSPVSGEKDFHKGIDIANIKGTSVIATADGIVTHADLKEFLGKLVTIDHGHGVVTKYGHLSKVLVKPGDTVKRGDIIGEMGNSGRIKGLHVHYEIRLNGLPVNPARYILN